MVRWTAWGVCAAGLLAVAFGSGCGGDNDDSATDASVATFDADVSSAPDAGVPDQGEDDE